MRETDSPLYKGFVERESFQTATIAHWWKVIPNKVDDLAPARGLVWSAGLGGMLWGLILAGLWLAGLL
jgi:hypothetical protein